MTIDDAIEMLEAMKREHGNVEVFADCESCGHATHVDKVVAVVERTTVRLAPSKARPK